MNETSSSETSGSANFDPQRAAKLRGQAQDAFNARHRKAARLTWGSLVGCMLAGWWCVHMFLAVDDMRSWLVWSVLFIMIFETTVLMKLWYWVVNSKLSVLREVKLLRMDLAVQRQSDAALEQIARVESPANVPGVTKSERYLWMAAIMAIGALIGVEIAQHLDRHYRTAAQMTSETRVILAADGTAQVQATYTLANTTGRSLDTFAIYSGGKLDQPLKIPAADSMWADGLGRKLEVLREPHPNGLNYRDVIRLIDPVPPGQHFTLSSTFPLNALHENGTWIFTHDQNWGYSKNSYRSSVELPKGAVLVSADPAPASRERQGDTTVVRFTGERASGAKWAYVVKYRLQE